MKFSMSVCKAIRAHMSIDLRRRNVSMPKHLLDRAQICPMIDQVRREGMAKHVRSHILADIGLPRSLFDHLPHARSTHFAPFPCQEYCRILRRPLAPNTHPQC